MKRLSEHGVGEGLYVLGPALWSFVFIGGALWGHHQARFCPRLLVEHFSVLPKQRLVTAVV